MGLVLPDREYVLISKGSASFDRPDYPGPCPTTLSDDAKTRTREMAVHKAMQIEYEQVLGVEQALRHLILRAVPKEWLAGIKNKYTGVSHLSIIDILSHLKTEGADLEDLDVEELNRKMNEAWSIDETPATYFQRMDEYEEQLAKAGIAAQPVLRLALFKAQVQATGEFDLEIDEWDRKTATSKTFANFRPYIQKKWARKHAKNRTNTKTPAFGIANSATDKKVSFASEPEPPKTEEEAVAELMALMQSENEKKFEEFMKTTASTLTATTKALEALSSKVSGGGSGGGGGGGTNNSRQRKPCPHCKKRHIKQDDCWELDKNKDKRPANWKSVKESS